MYYEIVILLIWSILGQPRTKIHDSGNGQFEFDGVKIV